jgi:hypothetical protein
MKVRSNRIKQMMPRQMIGNRKRNKIGPILSAIDLTGEDNKREHLDFIYLPGNSYFPFYLNSLQ